MLPCIKIFQKSIDSTNRYASQLAVSGNEKQNVWIRAENQYAGKGQGKNSWMSESGKNLTGSLLLFPEDLEASAQFGLSMAFSLAASDLLELYLESVRIKWPNDLYVRDKKIGGILIETAIMGSRIDYAILGLGLNVNQVRFDPELPNPESIKNLTGLELDLEALEDLFLECFSNRYEELRSTDAASLSEAYRRKLYRFKEFAPFRSRGAWFNARILGVDEFGRLLLENELGRIETFGFQEVEFVI